MANQSPFLNFIAPDGPFAAYLCGDQDRTDGKVKLSLRFKKNDMLTKIEFEDIMNDSEYFNNRLVKWDANKKTVNRLINKAHIDQFLNDLFYVYMRANRYDKRYRYYFAGI